MADKDSKSNYQPTSFNYNWEEEIAVPQNLQDSDHLSSKPSLSFNDFARLATEEESRIAIENQQDPLSPNNNASAGSFSPNRYSNNNVDDNGKNTFSQNYQEPLPPTSEARTRVEEEAKRLQEEKVRLAAELAEKRKAALAARLAAEEAIRRAEEESQRKADSLKKLQEEATAKRQAEETARRNAEEKIRLEAVQFRIAKETALRKQEELAKSLQEQELMRQQAEQQERRIAEESTGWASLAVENPAQEQAKSFAFAEAKRATEQAIKKSNLSERLPQNLRETQNNDDFSLKSMPADKEGSAILTSVSLSEQGNPQHYSPTTDSTAVSTDTMSTKVSLPHPDASLEGLYKLANEAESQAQFAAAAARNASLAAHSNLRNLSPNNPEIANKIQQSTFAAAKNAVEAAKAALKAQSGAMEATATAISQSMRELDRNKELLHQQETSIIKLGNDMEGAQSAINAALESFRAAKAKAEEEAAKIQQCKQQLSQATQEKQNIEQNLIRAQENLNYAHVRARETRATFLNIQSLTEATEKDLYSIVHGIPLQQPYPSPPATLNRQREQSGNNSIVNGSPKPKQNSGSVAEEEAIDIEVSNIQTDQDFQPELEETELKPSVKSILWSYGKVVIIAFAIAFLLRAFVFEITQVDGPSMIPTLTTDDRLITSKLAYRFGEPSRGDIIVLDAPDDPGQYYIKRIIGLPNEHLSIKDGRVYIDGIKLEELYLTQLLTEGDIDVVIPEGYYFVMGDNRDESRDSRMDSIGLISEDAIQGKSVFRIFPWDKMGSLY